MFINSNKFIYDDLVPMLTDTFVKEFGCAEDWLENSLLSHQPPGPDILDNTTDDQTNLHALVVYDRIELIDPYIQERFTKFRELLSISLPKILSVHVALLGPNSVVPLHSDSHSKGRNPDTDVNILIGCVITDPTRVGFQLAGIDADIEYGRGLVFDGKIPHRAWNKTDSWAVTMILYINKSDIDNASH